MCRERLGPEIVTRVPIECFPKQYGGINIHVYDTRGFFSGYGEDGDILTAIQQTRPGCDYDVVVVCMNFLYELDRYNNKVLSIIHKLKSDIWSRTHVALTHTDSLPVHVLLKLRQGKSLKNIYEPQETCQKWKKNITHYLNKQLNVYTDLPIYNTTHIKLKSKMKILNNWLPRFLLGILYQSRLLSLQTTLSVLLDHPLTEQAIKKANKSVWASFLLCKTYSYY